MSKVTAGPFQAEAVGDAAGDDGGHVAGGRGTPPVLRRTVHEVGVVVAVGPDEDADGCAAQACGSMPARSMVSQAISSRSRCCGSMARASRGEIPKKSASNSAASWTKPPRAT